MFLLQEIYSEDSYLSINGDPNQIRLDTIRVKSLGINSYVSDHLIM